MQKKKGKKPEDDEQESNKGPAGDGIAGLLESLDSELPDEPDEDDDDEDDDDDAGTGGAGDGGVDPDDIVARLEQRLASRFDAVADRRVNAILNEMRGRKQGKGSTGPVTGVTEPSVDVRAARLTFKEYLTDDLQFIGPEERKMAMDMGSALIAQRATSYDDEELLGRAVADDVAKQVKAIRKFYEAKTLDALRRRGALKKGDGQPPAGPPQIGNQSDWAKGAALAGEMFGKKS